MKITDEYIAELEKHNERFDREYDSTIELFEKLKETQEYFDARRGK